MCQAMALDVFDAGDRPTEDGPVRSASRVWIGGHDRAARRIAGSWLGHQPHPPTGPIDVAVITPKSIQEAIYFAEKLRDRLRPAGVLWIMASSPGICVDHSGESLAEFTTAMQGIGYAEAPGRLCPMAASGMAVCAYRLVDDPDPMD